MTDWKLGSLIWTESQIRLEFPILIHVLTLLNLGSTPLTDIFTFTFQVETIIIGNSMSKITTWCWMILHEVNNTSVNTFVCVQKWRVSVLLCWTTTQNFQSNFLTWDFPLLLSKPWGSGLLSYFCQCWSKRKASYIIFPFCRRSWEAPKGLQTEPGLHSEPRQSILPNHLPNSSPPKGEIRCVH